MVFALKDKILLMLKGRISSSGDEAGSLCFRLRTLDGFTEKSQRRSLSDDAREEVISLPNCRLGRGFYQAPVFRERLGMPEEHFPSKD